VDLDSFTVPVILSWRKVGHEAGGKITNALPGKRTTHTRIERMLQSHRLELWQPPIILPDHLLHILRDRQTTRQPGRIEPTQRDQARSCAWIVADVKVGERAAGRGEVWADAGVVWREELRVYVW
jgi:hypothetical protein